MKAKGCCRPRPGWPTATGTVVFIVRAQSLGFALGGIAEHLRSPPGEAARKARLQTRLETKRAELDAHIEEAMARRAVIDQLIEEVRAMRGD
jgi:DNA-binding transcriptional MerR regulator